MTMAYPLLEKKFKKIHTLGDASAMLQWDMASMMPKGGAQARAEQMAVLATLRHSLLTDEETGDLLARAETEGRLDDWQVANLREMQREYQHATALDEGLVEKISRATSACEQVWRDARAEGDFKKVLPRLRDVLTLTREAAAAKSEKLGVSKYDALLDQYEPDGSARDIDAIFGPLEAFLPDFTQEVLEKQKSRDIKPFDGPFPIKQQKELGTRFMSALGFDFEHGRLDVSLHPFCGGTPDDVRLTTRYDENDFTSALMGVLHETGHALYERGLPKAWRNQPVGTARGMSIHESQSLLMEMQVCRGDAFLRYALPHMKEVFGKEGPAWSLNNLTNLYHKVEPGFIRVDADEVTYPSHVILRYRLERALIEGSMELEDLPTAWNEGMQKMLGITPPSDREGCLQDIHWFDGAWGYFPTYTLGAMTAAQVFAALRKEIPEVDQQIEQGDFKNLLAWLRDHIHSVGSRLSTQNLLKRATGKTLDPQVFITHLKDRYLGS